MKRFLILCSVLFLCIPNCYLIPLDSANVNYSIQLVSPNKTSWIETYLPNIIDGLTLLVAVFGVFIALPRLRKKLGENHISNSLGEIQTVNKEINYLSQKLIDKYIPLTFTNEKISLEEFKKEYQEIQNMYYKALYGSSDVVTVLFYLKNTLALSLKHYDGKNIFFFTRNLYGFVIECLEDVVSYTKVVQMPYSTKTKKVERIAKRIRKFASHASYEKFKHYNSGVIPDTNCAHLIIFASLVNIEEGLIRRSAYQVHSSHIPIAILLYNSRIYAPLILEKKTLNPFIGNSRLNLIGFSKRGIGEEQTVTLMYSNINDFGSFIDAMKPDEIKEYYDPWISISKDQNNRLWNVPFNKERCEIITVTLKNSMLHDDFKQKQRQLKAIIKKLKYRKYL